MPAVNTTCGTTALGASGLCVDPNQKVNPWGFSAGAKYAGTSIPLEGLGVTPNLGAPNDALALLLFLLALPPFGFMLMPLAARVSRRHEFEADAYACAHASGRDLASALLKLHEDNAGTLTPDPVYVAFYYSHPAASERLAALKMEPA